MKRPTETSGPTWPINEIVWRALVLRGLGLEEIAARCGVRPEHVAHVVAGYRF